MIASGGAWGILGGTFDPVHNAHIRLAVHAYNELHLEKVIFIPAYIPPHKTDRIITGEKHRLEMTRLAVRDFAEFEVSDIELKLSGASYTARTLTILAEQNENLVFILGADSYMALDSWYHPEIIFAKARIACACRDGISAQSIKDKADFYDRKYGAVTHLLRMDDTDISSTEIRRLIAEGKDAERYLPAAVYKYIRENGLYLRDKRNVRI